MEVPGIANFFENDKTVLILRQNVENILLFVIDIY